MSIKISLYKKQPQRSTCTIHKAPYINKWLYINYQLDELIIIYS